ncbi:hypothetical protein EDB80DRAFT_737175 [Ilyonectria destructans]|nr:hypothetical protein BKA56DRAFT_706506 [Ilyonectria sp. MPI-CAGE-AT-0026]KAH6981421.1 hypothetical protein EDB80DRAFT_737175 [Ilyonectria destructans]
MNSPQARKRKFARRSKKGCQWCKQKHIRCDEQRPACLRCRQKGNDCIYPTPECALSHSKCERGPSSNANSNTHVAIVEPSQVMGYYPLVPNSHTGSSFEVPFQLPFPQSYPGLELYSAVAGVLNGWQAERDVRTDEHAYGELGMLTSPESHEIRLDLVPTAQASEFGLQAMPFPTMDGSAATAEVHPHLNLQDTVFSMVTH